MTTSTQQNEIRARIRLSLDRLSRSEDTGQAAAVPAPSFPAFDSAEYAPDLPEALFSAGEYLTMNPDYEDAARRGEVPGPRVHWETSGRREGRSPRIDLKQLLDDVASQDLALTEAADELGEPTPGPETLRGRLGATVIGLVRKSLWWYTHRLKRFGLALRERESAALAAMRALQHRVDALTEYADSTQSTFHALNHRMEKLTRQNEYLFRQLDALSTVSDAMAAQLRLLPRHATRLDQTEAQIQALQVEHYRLQVEHNQAKSKLAETGASATTVSQRLAGRLAELELAQIRQQSMELELATVDQVDELRGTISGHGAAVAAVASRLDTVEPALDALTLDVKRASVALQTSITVNSTAQLRLREKQDSLEASAENTRERVSAVEAIVEELGSADSETAEQVETLRAEVAADMELATSQTTTSLCRLRKELTEALKHTRTEVETTIDDQLGHMTPRLDQLRASLDRVETATRVRAENLNDRFSALQHQVTDLAGSAADPEAERQRLAAAVNAELEQTHLAERQKELAARLEGVEEEFRQTASLYRSGGDDLAGTLELLRSQVADLAGSVPGLAARQQEIELRVQSADGGVKLDAIEGALNDVRSRLESTASAYSGLSVNLSGRMAELGRLIQATRQSVRLNETRLSMLGEQARKRLPEPFDAEQIEAVSQIAGRDFDSMYVAFEDLYRGTREEIMARQSVYVPLIREAGVGTPIMPLFDLGCGRGEWLELLNSNGFTVYGVDSNEVMVGITRSLGLEVKKSEALAWLRAQPDSSAGAITTFHMLEHIPFDAILQFFEESLRVLKSGGLLLFEVPNPNNLLVAARDFYNDPTHIRPLPAGMMRFVAENRGFCNVEIREVNPAPNHLHLPETADGVGQLLNQLLYGPQDYSISARKV